MKSNNIDRIIKTDVLTIGGGGASVAAAVSVYQQGAKVTLVSKGKVGRSGNTIMIGGGFSIDGESAHNVCGIEEANINYTKDILFENTVRNSFYLSDQNIVQQFVDEAPIAVKQCLEWAKNAKQLFKFAPSTSAWRVSGRGFGNTLMHGIKENPGIEVFEDIMIVDIIKNDGKAVGALGVDIYTGKFIMFEAKAIVLGTGGYQPYSLKNSISDMTGDGIAMAYRAGAKISDMEFLLFIPTIMEPRNIRGSILAYQITLPLFFPRIYKVTDYYGNELTIPEEFKAISAGSKLSKIIYSYFWGQGAYKHYKEHGNCIYYDFSHCSAEEIEEAFENLKERYSLWHKRGTYNKIDFEEFKQYVLKYRKLKIGLGCEYSMGGVEVDERMRTEIPGLFAAGEVTSGLFGAFRGGDGLTEMLTHGFRAGTSAVEYIKELDTTHVDYDVVNSVIDETLEPFNRNEGISPYKIQENIEEATDNGFNFFRNEKGLQSALNKLEKIKNEEIPKMSLSSKSTSYNFEWITSILLRNLIICNETGVRAALLRKESRGCHMRTDYPEVNNDDWLVKIQAQREGSEIKFTTREPVFTKMAPQKGIYQSIPDYILKSIVK